MMVAPIAIDAARSRPRVLIERLALCAIAAVVFLAMIGKRDIVTSHEGRVAQTARQMAAVGWPWSSEAHRGVRVPIVGMSQTANGKRMAPLPREGFMSVNPWLVPVINGQVRLQKPPLPYWCAAVMYRLFAFGEGWTRLVPALLGACATLLIWDLARTVLGRRAALPAAIVWVTTHFVVDEFRKAMADPYLTFFTLLAVWSWVRGGAGGAIVFWIAMALGALAKGPVMLLTALPAVVLGVLLLRRRKRAAWMWHLVGFALFLALALPWPIYVMRYVPHAMELWRYESIGEFGENAEKARPWWLYALTSFQLPLPWTPMWVAGVVLALMPARREWLRVLRGPRGRRRWFALGWFLVVLVVFSFANVKKNAYLLPVAAAMTLSAADALALVMRLARREGFKGLIGVLAAAQAVIGIGFGLGVAVLCWRQTDLDRFAGVTVSMLAAGLAAAALWMIVRSAARRWLWLSCAAYALTLVAFIGIYMADRENNRSPKPFARALAQYVQANSLPILKQQLPEDASVYLPLDVPGATPASPRVIVVIDDNRRDIDKGKAKADDALFAPVVDGTPILAIERIHLSADDGRGRWKAYVLTLDRGRAHANTRFAAALTVNQHQIAGVGDHVQQVTGHAH
jgi:4-amino-4-deoxy-L-arabinose transferase-like glycosyltransferase